MAKEPMRLSQEAKNNMLGYGTAAAMGVGVSLGNNPAAAVIGGAAAGAIGAGVGLVKTAVDAVRDRRQAEREKSLRSHPALGRQWPKG
jgi:sugar (pentulose or hexulose) kinase